MRHPRTPTHEALDMIAWGLREELWNPAWRPRRKLDDIRLTAYALELHAFADKLREENALRRERLYGEEFSSV